jgi:hypothetical protein
MGGEGGRKGAEDGAGERKRDQRKRDLVDSQVSHAMDYGGEGRDGEREGKGAREREK